VRGAVSDRFILEGSQMPHDHSRAARAARRLSVALTALALSAVAFPARSQTTSATATPADREAVRRAVLDYVEGFYEGDTTKFIRSIRPDVYKYGFWRQRDSTSYAGERMNWPEFFAYARGVKQNNRPAPATAPKKVEVFEVQNQTASAKVTAFWGTDYLLLGKYDGKWMISSVMWQSPPRS
jgi:hypothetical protein